MIELSIICLFTPEQTLGHSGGQKSLARRVGHDVVTQRQHQKFYFSIFHLFFNICLSLCQWCVCALHHSIVSNSETPWTGACQVPLSMGFSRQEYWNRLPFPSPGHLPDSEVKPALPVSPAMASRYSIIGSSGKPIIHLFLYIGHPLIYLPIFLSIIFFFYIYLCI